MMTRMTILIHKLHKQALKIQMVSILEHNYEFVGLGRLTAHVVEN